jgi:hypothetical protein
MNAGFELMWCNFHDGLTHVSRLNITPPDTPQVYHPSPAPIPPRQELFDSTESKQRLPGLALEEPNPTTPPPTTRPPWRYPRAPLTLTSNFEWARTAVRRALDPQPYVRLLPAGLLTYYDPAYTSLAPSRKGQIMHSHRIWANISSADAESAAARLEVIVSRPGVWDARGVRWDMIARRVVEGWGDRLAQLNATLHRVDLNATRRTQEARLLAYTALNPFIDTTGLPYANQSEPEVWLPPARQRCTAVYTSLIPSAGLSPEEILLKASIETVASRLCGLIGNVLAQTLDNEGSTELISRIASQLEELMDWLDWAVWTRCSEDCGIDVRNRLSERTNGTESNYDLSRPSAQSLCGQY